MSKKKKTVEAEGFKPNPGENQDEKREDGAVKEDNQEKKPKKKGRGRKALKIILIILLVIVCLIAVIAVLNVISYKSNRNFIKNSIAKVEYTNQLKPVLADDGYYTFTTDDGLKIMQLTDIHIGSGFMSTKKDNMAINACAAMITAEKPDLVIVTGDIAYPVPFQAGTLNNKPGAVTFAEMMEKLGVYWAPVYGNHDTEVYSLYSRKDISEIYSDKEKYPHCLFQSGPEDINGYGNYVINVKNTKGEIVQSLIMFDSNSYTDDDKLGISWNYDAIHADQVQWYDATIKSLTKENGGKTPKSLAFFHIPIQEMKTAFNEYKDNGYKDTKDVKYIYGKLGESGMMICASKLNFGLFDKMLEDGSTQGVFFGHDHLNNMSLEYKGIRLTYGYSIDYLAYSGISTYGLQRGCTLIKVNPDGSFDCEKENYYQEKYKSVNKKETVTLNQDMEYGVSSPFADNN